MPKLWLHQVQLVALVKISMSFTEFTKIHINVTAVIIDERVIACFLKGSVKVFFRILKVSNVVQSKTTVIVMKTVRLQTNSLGELIQSVLVLLLLEVRETEVVMRRVIFGFEANSLLQIID